MSAIINFFDWIINFFKTIFDFVTNIFTTIGLVFKYLYTTISLATNIITTLPNWLQAFGIICLSICAIYMIIGRDPGKSESRKD